MRVAKDDTVLVISGKDKGKRGKVINTEPPRQKVLVEGVNRVKKHLRRTTAEKAGGIVEREMPVHVSNVMVVCPKCDKPTRVASRVLDNGDKARVCKKCGEVIDRGM